MVELAVEPAVESRGAGFLGPAGTRRLEGSGRPPIKAGGKTQARPMGGHPPSGGQWIAGGGESRQWALPEDRREGIGRVTRPSWKTIGDGPTSAPPLGLGSPRKPNLAGAAHGGCWMGLAGPEAWSRRKASLARIRAFGDGHGQRRQPK